MDAIWVIASSALIAFCLVASHKIAYWRGYKTGANMVLDEWRTVVNKLEDDDNV